MLPFEILCESIHEQNRTNIDKLIIKEQAGLRPFGYGTGKLQIEDSS